jgi:hypothetical protein
MLNDRRYQPRPRRRKYDYDKVYDFIVAFKIDNDGNSPSYRMIKRGLKISTISTVLYIIEHLEDDGKIYRSHTGILVTGGEWIPPSQDLSTTSHVSPGVRIKTN